MLYTYFLNNSKNKNRKLFIVLFLLTLACIFSLQYFDSFLKTDVAPQGIVSFEFGKDLSKSIRIIDNWKENEVVVAAGLSLGLDFLFIFSYTTFIALLLFLVSYKNSKWIYIAGKTLISVILIAGFIDVVENISLINLLLGKQIQFCASLAFYMAFSKFVIVFVSVLFIVVVSFINFLRKLLKVNKTKFEK